MCISIEQQHIVINCNVVVDVIIAYMAGMIYEGVSWRWIRQEDDRYIVSLSSWRAYQYN